MIDGLSYRPLHRTSSHQPLFLAFLVHHSDLPLPHPLAPTHSQICATKAGDDKQEPGEKHNCATRVEKMRNQNRGSQAGAKKKKQNGKETCHLNRKSTESRTSITDSKESPYRAVTKVYSNWLSFPPVTDCRFPPYTLLMSFETVPYPQATKKQYSCQTPPQNQYGRLL